MSKTSETPQVDPSLALIPQKRPVVRPAGSVKNKDGSDRKVGFGFAGTTPNFGLKPGGPVMKPWKEALQRAIAQADGKVLRKLADALVKKAAEGDVQALKEIGDRLDGRAVQQVEQKVSAVVTVRTEDADL